MFIRHLLLVSLWEGEGNLHIVSALSLHSRRIYQSGFFFWLMEPKSWGWGRTDFRLPEPWRMSQMSPMKGEM